MIECRLCSENIKKKLFSGKLLEQNIDYFECPQCGYVQTEFPYWLEKAYKSKIHNQDTGIMIRNSSNISLVLATLIVLGSRNKTLVDYAGGYGLLVRSLRDLGIDALWKDPYCENLVARGFEYKSTDKISLVTAFEVFEHFVNPAEEMDNLLKIAPNILITSEIIDHKAPKPEDWWYYGLNHGQHIGFFRLKTFKYLADKFKLNFISDGASRHLFSKKKISFKLWITILKISKFIPGLLSIGLKSKTRSDQLLIEKNSKTNN